MQEGGAAGPSAALPGTDTDRRERRCLVAALAAVPAGSAVLDLPCGTGRLLGPLCGMGYQLTAADSSAHMVDLARQHADAQRLSMPAARFVVTDVMATPFADEAFDAVVCNRLFHHFRESEVRRQALRELRRIARGPIVVSFFRNLAWDAMTFHLKHFIRRRRPTDRIPINLSVFRRDVEAAGLTITQTLGVRPLISKNWYAVLRRA